PPRYTFANGSGGGGPPAPTPATAAAKRLGRPRPGPLRAGSPEPCRDGARPRCAPRSHAHAPSFDLSRGPSMNTPQTRRFNVAVVGATGAVGAVMLSVLAERNFPVGTLVPLASERSAGNAVEFRAQELVAQHLASFDPSGIDIALFPAGGETSKQYAPKFAAAGAVVIDNSSAFRYDDDVPLVVSEVNPEQVRNRPRGIVANPNCSTMQLLVALAPLHRRYGIERVNVATYQSV